MTQHLDGGVDQRVRDRVIVAVDLDVIIDVDARLAPFGVDVAVARERLQRRSIEALEEVAPRRAAVPLHRAGIESVSSSAIRAFSAASVKKVSWRSRARIQRSATCTATSTFALSRGLAGRAGTMAVP